jgi:molybdopterin-guanine dinucleotide biosynthesis protein
MSPLLVVVNGPIASGKSTLAQALGRELRERGRRAAVIDLDLLYDMLDHRPKSDEALWLLARQASALLADRFWAAGIDAVVVEGSFSDAPKRAALLEGLTTEVKPRIVTLRVSFAEALRRAQGDPTRGLSRDPTFLAGAHADFAARLDPAGTTDLVVDTEQTTPERLAAELADSLLDRHGPYG